MMAERAPRRCRARAPHAARCAPLQAFPVLPRELKLQHQPESAFRGKLQPAPPAGLSGLRPTKRGGMQMPKPNPRSGPPRQLVADFEPLAVAAGGPLAGAPTADSRPGW